MTDCLQVSYPDSVLRREGKKRYKAIMRWLRIWQHMGETVTGCTRGRVNGDFKITLNGAWGVSMP